MALHYTECCATQKHSWQNSAFFYVSSDMIGNRKRHLITMHMIYICDKQENSVLSEPSLVNECHTLLGSI